MYSESTVTETVPGWNFDTNLSPQRARALLVDAAPSRIPAGSWLRLRGMKPGEWKKFQSHSAPD